MARKDLLKSLMAPPAPSDEARAPQRSDRGAIGAVSKSINELKSRAIIEVPADMIDDAGIRDRMDEDAAGIEALRDSIRAYGQQVPVLLRHSPNFEGRFEIVFGRRRVHAMRGLGIPVRAMLRQLNDHELVVAQGQENSARKDLTFIEKANFAAQMVKAGFERKVICDALSIDKTVISRMLNVTDVVPEPLIHAIGAAPSAGRDRWLALASKIAGRPLDDLIAAAQGPDSDTRFAAVLRALKTQSEGPASRPLSADQTALGSATTRPGRTVITLTGEGQALGDWLIENFEEIYRQWKERAHGPADE